MIKASKKIKSEIKEKNCKYEKKFGYIFIIFATGKSGQEILNSLVERLDNSPSSELKIAMMEQIKITELRLEKLLEKT